MPILNENVPKQKCRFLLKKQYSHFSDNFVPSHKRMEQGS